MVVELGIKLDKNIEYYDSMLKSNGLKCVFNVVTHDVYYSNKLLNDLTEHEMKKACIRLRSCNGGEFNVDNRLLSNIEIKKVKNLTVFENLISKYGYKKVFDTTKEDYHYYKEGMNSRIQLQQIKDIGLLVYYDNSNYYDLDLDTQRKMLIDDLKFYGFEIDYSTFGLDKLRTLYYGKEMYSKNQNG